MGPVHAAFGRRLLVLLNCHGIAPCEDLDRTARLLLFKFREPRTAIVGTAGLGCPAAASHSPSGCQAASGRLSSTSCSISSRKRRVISSTAWCPCRRPHLLLRRILSRAPRTASSRFDLEAHGAAPDSAGIAPRRPPTGADATRAILLVEVPAHAVGDPPPVVERNLGKAWQCRARSAPSARPCSLAKRAGSITILAVLRRGRSFYYSGNVRRCVSFALRTRIRRICIFLSAKLAGLALPQPACLCALIESRGGSATVQTETAHVRIFSLHCQNVILTRQARSNHHGSMLLILASTSRYRRELLERLGLQFPDFCAERRRNPLARVRRRKTPPCDWRSRRHERPRRAFRMGSSWGRIKSPKAQAYGWTSRAIARERASSCCM